MAMTSRFHIRNSEPVTFITCQSCEKDQTEIFQVDGNIALAVGKRKHIPMYNFVRIYVVDIIRHMLSFKFLCLISVIPLLCMK